ncbi:MAG: choice-of-anchor Q domain-containing protein [Anaerolineae bacterium]
MNRFAEWRHGTLWFGCVVVLSGLLVGVTLLLTGGQTARANPGVIYVDADAAPGGGGTSWSDAYTDLQSALKVAGPGDEIWVAEGVYYPADNADDRTATFKLRAGVALVGGFAGGEKERDQRNWETNVTVLSGDLDRNDTTDAHGVVVDTENIVGANAYHVVTGDGVTETAVLDGFVITAGSADGSGPQNSGGGMFNEDSSPMLSNVVFSGNWASSNGGGMINFRSNPTLANVAFGSNQAADGGALFNGSSSPTLTNVIFSGNHAVSNGGAMANWSSSPTLTDVTFSRNTTESEGGGMIDNYSSSPTLTNVTFSGNQAGSNGGGMVNYDSSSPTLTNVTFSGNRTSSHGGGMYNGEDGSPTLTRVTFTGNQAAWSGGAMYNDNSSPSLDHVTFSDNQAASYGGGMCNSSSNPALTNVTFSGNWALAAGGGILNSSSSPTLTGVIFRANEAGGSGGGMANENSGPTLTSVTFTANQARDGGGMLNLDSSPRLTNVIFSGNRAAGYGGGMANSISSSTLINVTFSGNQATGYGGGMVNSDSNPMLVNAILWGNEAPTDPEIYNLGTSAPDVRHSNIQGGHPGTGNIDANPLFVDPVDASEAPTTDGDYRLTEGSPAVDVGFDDAVVVTTDLDGNPRIVDGTGDGSAVVDMGAYELQIPLLTIIKEGEGAVTSTPGSIDCGSICTGAFLTGSSVTLTATADPGWTFVGWSRDVESTENPLELAIERDTTITATFEEMKVYLPLVLRSG